MQNFKLEKRGKQFGLKDRSDLHFAKNHENTRFSLKMYSDIPSITMVKFRKVWENYKYVKKTFSSVVREQKNAEFRIN